jgi:hypothetical protein
MKNYNDKTALLIYVLLLGITAGVTLTLLSVIIDAIK